KLSVSFMNADGCRALGSLWFAGLTTLDIGLRSVALEIKDNPAVNRDDCLRTVFSSLGTSLAALPKLSQLTIDVLDTCEHAVVEECSWTLPAVTHLDLHYSFDPDLALAHI